jgi:hypothetical protein
MSGDELRELEEELTGGLCELAAGKFAGECELIRVEFRAGGGLLEVIDFRPQEVRPPTSSGVRASSESVACE